MSSDLQHLLDERAIIAVAVRYCWALDTRDWPLLDDVFVPSATAVLGGGRPLEGRDAIADRCRAALSPLDDSQHMVSNHEVTVDGDVATHRCYVQAQHIRHAADGSPNYVIAGRYEDRLSRTTDGWRITHRDLIVMWTEGNLGVVDPRHDGP